MKHIKTFESFKLNEGQDMMFMPVDPMKGVAETYSDIAKALGGKFKEAIDKVEEVSDRVVEEIEEIEGDISDILTSVEKFFGINAKDLTYDKIISKLKSEFGNSNESFIDKYDAADPYDGHGETMNTPLKDVKGGPVQKIGKILQNIFGINILTIGALGSFVTWIAGVTVNPAMSMIYSIIGLIVVHIVRKLATMANA